MFIRRCNTTTMLLLFAVLLTALSLPGCARHRDPDQNQMQMGGQSVQDQAASSQSTHFVRTPEGQNYYVDTRGQRHVIVREVREAPGAAGALYYIEDDDRPYYRDQSDRLYYRDADRIYYIEDRPGRPSETMVIQRGPEVYAPRAPMMSPESCESQYQECMAGCRGISPRQPYDRPNCIRNCDTIRSGCLGR